MDGQVVFPLDLSRTLPAGGGLLVPYSLSGSPAIKQLCKWLLWCLARVGGFNQCASPNTSNEYPGLISFRIDWFDLLAVQGTLKSLLQHHSSKTSRFPWSFALQMVKYDLVSTLDITKRNK